MYENGTFSGEKQFESHQNVGALHEEGGSGSWQLLEVNVTIVKEGHGAICLKRGRGRGKFQQKEKKKRKKKKRKKKKGKEKKKESDLAQSNARLSSSLSLKSQRYRQK